MWERSDYSTCKHEDMRYPTPVAPVYSIFDFVRMDHFQVKYWTYTIPADGMVYTLCTYTLITTPGLFMDSAIKVNDDYVWWAIGGLQLRWSPGYNSSVRFRTGDVLTIAVADQYDGRADDYYWQMDFWRDFVNP